MDYLTFSYDSILNLNSFPIHLNVRLYSTYYFLIHYYSIHVLHDSFFDSIHDDHHDSIYFPICLNFLNSNFQHFNWFFPIHYDPMNNHSILMEYYYLVLLFVGTYKALHFIFRFMVLLPRKRLHQQYMDQDVLHRYLLLYIYKCFNM